MNRYYISSYAPRGLQGPLKWEREKVDPPPVFYSDDFYRESGGALPKIEINLHRTYEKLHCNGESYRFGDYRDCMVQIERYRSC